MATATYTPRLKNKYKDEVIPSLMKRFGYKSIMQVPRLQKIAINRGVNGAVNDKKLIDIALDELSTIRTSSSENRLSLHRGCWCAYARTAPWCASLTTPIRLRARGCGQI